MRRPWRRLFVTIQRADTGGVISLRFSEYGSALYNLFSDPVFEAINSATINLAECYHGMIRGHGGTTLPVSVEQQLSLQVQARAINQVQEYKHHISYDIIQEGNCLTARTEAEARTASAKVQLNSQVQVQVSRKPRYD